MCDLDGNRLGATSQHVDAAFAKLGEEGVAEARSGVGLDGA